MTRCAPQRSPAATCRVPHRPRRARPVVASLLAALTTLAGFAAPIQAQSLPGHRVFPASALRGELQVTEPPQVLLNGRADRLAPGARIRGEDNLLLMSAAIVGQRLAVHYTREATSGLLVDVWVLRAVERGNRPWPATASEAQRWTFDPVAQTWTRP